MKLNLRNLNDHPAVVALTVIASVVTILAFAQTCRADSPSLADLSPCEAVIGRWDWLTTGGVVAFAEGGGLTWHRTPTAPAPETLGRWTCTAGSGEIVLVWPDATDSVTLSEDGNRLTGTNHAGLDISATRAR